MNPEGMRVLLTGATGGIGAAIGRELAARGANLLLTARDAGRLETQAAELREIAGRAGHGTRVECVPCDLRDAAERDLLARHARGFHGGVDVLVNNAGNNSLARFQDQSPEAIRSMLETNLIAPVLLTRALLAHLISRREACILNIGSVLGSIGMPGQAVYSTTKFGLHGFTESLRREVAHTGLAVRYLAPRATRTAMNGDAACRMNEELGVAMDPPERVARAAVELLAAGRRERFIGWPERLFVKLNAIAPRLVDGAFRKQRPVMENYLRAGVNTQ